MRMKDIRHELYSMNDRGFYPGMVLGLTGGWGWLTMFQGRWLAAAGFLAAGLILSPVLSRRLPRYRVRGTTYRVLGRATLQTGRPAVDQADLVLYRSEDTGSLFVRPAGEFYDGRFTDA